MSTESEREPDLGGVCWERACGLSVWPAMPCSRHDKALDEEPDSLTIPRAPRATLEQPSCTPGRKGHSSSQTLILFPLHRPDLQPLQGGGRYGAQGFGVPFTRFHKKIFALRTHAFK